MTKKIAARRGVFVAAALSAALVAPSLAPVASAETTEPADQALTSSGDTAGSSIKTDADPGAATGAKTDAKSLNFERNVTVKRGETTNVDLDTIATLPLGTQIKIKAGSDIASVDGSNLKLTAPKEGTTKVEITATPKVGPALNFAFNVSAGDKNTVTEDKPGLEALGDLSSNEGAGSSLENTGSSTEGDISLFGSSDDSAISNKCKVALVGLGVPLLALIPLGIMSQLALSGTANFTDQIGAQIRGINAQIQDQAGVLNPELAAQVEGVNNTLKQFGLNAGSAALAVVGAGAGLAMTAAVLSACLGNDSGSSENGSSAQWNGDTRTDKPTDGEADSDNSGSSFQLDGSSKADVKVSR